MDNLHPTFNQLLSRSAREGLLGQKGTVIWMTGLSGSGKSTIAQNLERRLFENGYVAQVLDGDNIRTGLNNNLSFPLEGRRENIRRISEVAKLFCNSGIITICSFVSPTIAIRKLAEEIIGKEDFIEVFINTSLEECERRDVKGLYQKAREGEIKGFTGIDSPYERPIDPDLEIDTMNNNIVESSNMIIEYCVQRQLLRRNEGKIGKVGEMEEIGQKEDKTGKPLSETIPNFYEVTEKGSGLENDEIVENVLSEPLKRYDRFEDLYIWKASRQLAKEVHLHFKDIDLFSLKNQIMRSSISISSNIAEGYERQTNKELIRYLYIAKGSCGELRSQLHMAKDLNIIPEEILDPLIVKSYGLNAMISKFIRYRSKFE